MQPTRREALVTIAALAAASSAEAQTTFLRPTELEWLKVLVDTIIPPTDTPGASDAGVPAFIQRRLALSDQLLTRFRAGIAAIDSASTEKFERQFPLLDAEQKTVARTAQQDQDSFHLVNFNAVEGGYS